MTAYCWLGIIFPIVALAFSVFYGLKARVIFFDDPGDGRKPSWKFHQCWLNVLGSLGGPPFGSYSKNSESKKGNVGFETSY
jgi:hypothetical protein